MHDHIATRYHRQGQLHVGILLFPEVEVLDFAGPFEVFSVAARISADSLGKAPFRVSLIGPDYAPVVARHGMQVVAHLAYGDADPASAAPLDLLIVPGGVVTGVLADGVALRWIAAAAGQAALTASVCTGAFVLAKLGLLEGLEVTTHWEDIALLRQHFPTLQVIENVRFVDHGHIVTSGGISAGIDMSLHLVGRLLGPAWAEATARQMEYRMEAEPGSAIVRRAHSGDPA